MKKPYIVLILTLLLSLSVFGQTHYSEKIQDKDVFSNFTRLSKQQLFDTALYYNSKGLYDTVLLCNQILINMPVISLLLVTII